MWSGQIKIEDALYKDIPAITLTNETLKMVVLPENGGKVASLVELRSGREFLLQTANQSYKKQMYDGDYTQGECSGFDDMFPTVDPVAYPDFPWQGTFMPDHGEVCALKWNYKIRDDSLVLSVDGIRFPYLFAKEISFCRSNRIRVAYFATNKSAYPFDYIFASHLMLNVEDNGRILLPGMDSATWGFSRFPIDGNYGDKIHWPTAIIDGQQIRLDTTPAFDINGNNYKFFADKPLLAGWCGYRYPDQTEFKLYFSPLELPAFCLWVNEGWFHGFRNIALEPCSAPFDRIDIARLHGKSSVLAPYETRRWTLEMEIVSK